MTKTVLSDVDVLTSEIAQILAIPIGVYFVDIKRIFLMVIG